MRTRTCISPWDTRLSRNGGIQVLPAAARANDVILTTLFFFFSDTCFLFVLLMYIFPRLLYFTEYEVLTAQSNSPFWESGEHDTKDVIGR